MPCGRLSSTTDIHIYDIKLQLSSLYHAEE